MTSKPQPDPEALAAAARRLQDVVERLRKRGVPLAEVQELADAARAYAATHAADKLARSRFKSTASPIYRSGMATVGHVKAVPLPLYATPRYGDSGHRIQAHIVNEERPAPYAAEAEALCGWTLYKILGPTPDGIAVCEKCLAVQAGQSDDHGNGEA